ncbi:hypothetical protein C8R46DRAFT_1106149 [Mycena filopes]|nr:hypothetical protein C8R46DRAFT_1106149 [Mycena filopes]
MASSTSPPPPSSGVFTIVDSILIDAPREKVWEALLDFGSWGKWNAYIRGATIVSPEGVASPDQTAAVDRLLRMSPVHIPPTMDDTPANGSQSSTVRITALDHENHRVAWVSADGRPKWALFVERWQTLTTEEDGKTRYENVEVFTGVLAYIVKFSMGKNLILGIRAMAEGLKSHSERA